MRRPLPYGKKSMRLKEKRPRAWSMNFNNMQNNLIFL